jgi:hypothetical protein
MLPRHLTPGAPGLRVLIPLTALLCVGTVSGEQSPEERFKAMSRDADAKGLAEPYKGITTEHFYIRQGVSFGEMNDGQRESAFGLLGAALSARGLKLSRDVMRLNETLAELKNNWQEYGEGRYFITVMGEPSEK